MPPIYSIIIPTYNRIEEIKELLASLDALNNDSPAFDLLIVDDGSTDGTTPFLQSYDAQYEILIYGQSNAGPGAARNLGMQKATGSYFLFIDSDCTLPKDYLVKLHQYILEYNPDAFGGPDTYHEDFPVLLKAINYAMTSFLGTGGTRGSEKSVTKYYPRSFNMGIHRKVFERIGGFGKLRHGQDMDYSARIYQNNFNVAFIKDAFVYHKRRTNLKRFYNQIHNWGVARINLGYLYPEMLKPIHFAPAMIVVISMIALILSLFTTIAKWVVLAGLIGSILIAIIAFVQSYSEYKDVKVAFLSIVTLFLQIAAYGLGSLNGLFQKIVLKRETAIGITKNYYGTPDQVRTK